MQSGLVILNPLQRVKDPHAVCTRDDRRDSSRSALRMTRGSVFLMRVIFVEMD
jgi:hypothetical protein